ncbi:hypothetical protein [Gimesia fumaroli]|uniref:DUF4185 domain-containing protein n=1 Tax=Gimesia fumaroli TaxID=2527976 RepID=A0A518ICA8_9PLAN|nr:hypothetical protein [Gimesia fumaroli]QDV50680.1 hypothetical protein Enr17x_27220 [Gimesia fumaroli]
MFKYYALLLSMVVCTTDILHGADYFQIQVVDAETERGIPLVELETVNQILHVTDSKGIVAFDEPGLMNQEVYFFLRSHGYSYPKDGFGFNGKKLNVKPGGKAVIKMKRINVAQRLYRVTGGGIYRDSLLVGAPVPLQEPVLNGRVLGSDSVVNTLFKNKVYWFWGDTNKPGYPLGNFDVPGAVSELPARGGLRIQQGVDLDYFLDETGFAKKTCDMPGEGPTWIDALVTLKDESGVERLFAKYVKVKAPMTVYERGLVEFNDELKQFDKQKVFDFDALLYPVGHPVKYKMEGVEYVLFGLAAPLTRVSASPSVLANLAEYETYTYLKPGTENEQWVIDRDSQGQLRYQWRKNLPPLSYDLEQKLILQGKLSAEEGYFYLCDIETKRPLQIHNSSVAWNAYRKKWTMIASQKFGTSVLGEIWYSEAESPLGPWKWARKIVTHNKYSFYNPKQHPMFAEEKGRLIYFEGTYTTLFSGNDVKTPRYDYNQIMYQLDLSDPRLAPELFQQ